MYATKAHFISTVLFVIGAGNFVPSPPDQVEQASLGITLIAPENQVLLGYPTIWKVAIDPLTDEKISMIEFNSGSGLIWKLDKDSITISDPSLPTVIELSMIPLLQGDFLPVLEVRYFINEEEQIHLVVANQPVHVKTITDQVATSVVMKTSKPTDSTIPLELSIHNQSPVAINLENIIGTGTDLVWDPINEEAEILPGKIYQIQLAPQLRGEIPKPQLFIEYSWNDADGHSHSEMQVVSGDAILIPAFPSREQVWGIFSVIVGIVIGAFATVIPRWLEEVQSRRRQEQRNRGYVTGLLRWIALRSISAINNAENIDLTFLNDLFKQEGLFRVLEKEKLFLEAKDLWEKAELYNSSLSKPGGTQHSSELRRAAERLEERLNQLNDNGKKTRS